MTELESAKIAGKARLQEEYESATASVTATVDETPYTVTGGMESFGRLSALAQASTYRNVEAVTFKLYDGTFAQLPLDKFVQFVNELTCVGVDDNFRLEQLYSAVDSATDIETINNIAW